MTSAEIHTEHSLIFGPEVEPVALGYARLHLKALTALEDELLTGWIAAARQHFEEQTGRQLITATRELWLDGFPCHRKIELPFPPLQSVVSVQYVDPAGDLQSLTDGGSPEVPLYSVRAPAGPHAGRGWLELNAGLTWPATSCDAGAVRIQFLCGYGDEPDAMPPLVTSALLFLVGHFDQFRSEVYQSERGSLDTLPFGMAKILEGFKYSALPSLVPRRASWQVWP